MKRIIFILGGARSGKSRFALELGNAKAGKKVYIATAEAGDAEMAARITRHQKTRGTDWQTLEVPLALSETLLSLRGKTDVVLIDCLTLWLSNVMMKTTDEAEINKIFDRLLDTLAKLDFTLIAVSNEVGQGIVPVDASVRLFRDLGGHLHQQWAHAANEVYCMTAGIPQSIKKDIP